MTGSALWLGSALTLAVPLLLLWLLSLRLRDASIIDPFWGTGFVLVAWSSVLRTPAPGPRAWLTVALVTAWGLRLSLYLLRRNAGHGEDYRYQAMRARHGKRFPVVSLLTVFALQGLLLWVISLPVQEAVARPGGLGIGDMALALLGAAGLTCEAVADVQLARFKADPASRGQVLDRGLWRYSRHPNYFGDAVVWWALGGLGALAGAPWALLSPVLMNLLLLKVSGVSLLERTIVERRPAYRDYIERTSAFVPWPPRQAAHSRSSP